MIALASRPNVSVDLDAPLPAWCEALVFDCDGTLVDTMPVHYVAWCAALGRVGLSFPEDRFYALAGRPTVTIVETLAREPGIACDAAARAHEKERLYLDEVDRVRPIEPVVAVARRERAARKLAVASGGESTVVRRTLRAAGVADLFETVVGAEHVARGKPSPDPFLRAAELLGVRPERCVAYEDADLGIEAALAAGMTVVDVRPSRRPR